MRNQVNVSSGDRTEPNPSGRMTPQQGTRTGMTPAPPTSREDWE